MHKVFRKHYEVFLKRNLNDPDAVSNFGTHITTFKRNKDIRDGDILHRFPKKELRFFARLECPTERLPNKAGLHPNEIIHAAKRVRFYLNIPENYACSRCSKREECNFRDILPRTKSTSVSDLLIVMNGLYDYENFAYKDQIDQQKKEDNPNQMSQNELKQEDLEEAMNEKNLEGEIDENGSEGQSELSEGEGQEVQEGEAVDEAKVEDRYGYKTYDSALKLVDTLYPIFNDIETRKGSGCKQYINTYIGENKLLDKERNEDSAGLDLSDGENERGIQKSNPRKEGQNFDRKSSGYEGRSDSFRDQRGKSRDFGAESRGDKSFGANRNKGREYRDQDADRDDYRSQGGKKDFGVQGRRSNDFERQGGANRDFKPNKYQKQNYDEDKGEEFGYNPTSKPYQYQERPKPSFDGDRKYVPYKRSNDKDDVSWGTKPDYVARRGQSYDSTMNNNSRDNRNYQKGDYKDKGGYKDKKYRNDDFDQDYANKNSKRRGQEFSNEFKGKDRIYGDIGNTRGLNEFGGRGRENNNTYSSQKANRGEGDVRERRDRNTDEDGTINRKGRRNVETFEAEEEPSDRGRRVRTTKSFNDKLKTRGASDQGANFDKFMSDVKE